MFAEILKAAGLNPDDLKQLPVIIKGAADNFQEIKNLLADNNRLLGDILEELKKRGGK